MSENPKIETSPGFWVDAGNCWRALPNKAFFFGLLAAWLAMFAFLGNPTLGYIHSSSLFIWLDSIYNRNSSADDAVGNLIPFLVIGLFWWKRKELLALPLRLWWPGLLVVVAGALMHIAGYMVQQPLLSVVAMITGVFGLMGMTWGWAWLKAGFFPFWLFIFSVPMSGQLLPLTFPLRLMSSWLTATVAHLLTINVIRSGTELLSGDGSYQFDVAAACSGIRSLVAIFLLATIYGFISFRSPWKRILLMALAFPLSVLGNFTRLMCIIFAAEIGGQSAGNYVHENSFFSLIPYIPAIAGLLWIGRWLGKNDTAKTQAEAQPEAGNQ